MISTIGVILGFIIDSLFGKSQKRNKIEQFIKKVIKHEEIFFQYILLGDFNLDIKNNFQKLKIKFNNIILKNKLQFSEITKENTNINNITVLKVIAFFMVAILFAIFTIVPLLLLNIAGQFNFILEIIIAAILSYLTFQTKSIKDEAKKIFEAISNDDLEEAKMFLSSLTSKNCTELNDDEIIKYCISYIAKSICDKIVGPLFYMAIFGSWIGLGYLAIFIMCELIKEKSEKYVLFSNITSKMIEIINFLPSIISAWILIFTSLLLNLDAKNGFFIYERDKKKFKNYIDIRTTSTMSGILNVELIGEMKQSKISIGNDNRQIGKNDILLANKIMYNSAIVALVLSSVIKLIIVGL